MPATTIEVRDLMRKHHITPQLADIYTNRRHTEPGNARTVKCYMRSIVDPEVLLEELAQLVGRKNVKVTGRNNPGIVVKCTLANVQ